MAMTRASDLRQPAAVNRPRELQDPLNYYVYHPLARRLARLLVPTPVTPNMVSVMSAGLPCAAAACFVGLAWPGNAVVGLFFMLLWHVVDGADGDLARMTGRASATGELVDGVCDYFGNTVMYFRLRLPRGRRLGRLGVDPRGGGRRQPYRADQSCGDPAPPLSLARLWRPRLRNARAEDDAVFERSSSWFTRYFGFWAVGYLWLSERMTPGANPIDRALVAADGNPAETERIRATVRASYAPTMWLPMLLGANPKTFLIAGAILAGSPIWYFLAMIGPVNLILLVSIVHFRRLGERTATQLSQR